jgi:hypothetical protein
VTPIAAALEIEVNAVVEVISAFAPLFAAVKLPLEVSASETSDKLLLATKAPFRVAVSTKVVPL